MSVREDGKGKGSVAEGEACALEAFGMGGLVGSRSSRPTVYG